MDVRAILHNTSVVKYIETLRNVIYPADDPIAADLRFVIDCDRL
jgi:hypothetical protein